MQDVQACCCGDGLQGGCADCSRSGLEPNNKARDDKATRNVCKDGCTQLKSIQGCEDSQKLMGLSGRSHDMSHSGRDGYT